MRAMLILKTGSTIPEASPRGDDFEDWILGGLGTPRAQALVVDVREGGALPEPETLSGVVVTGSASMVTERLPWSERAAAWLARAVGAGLPTLGICYGHQLLAHALGGVVAPNPRGREIGTVEITLTQEGATDPLLGPAGPRFLAHATHLEAVVRLPEGARHLASSALDPHHAFAVGERAWGVQFHPEFDAATVRAYVRARAAAIAAEGLDPRGIEAGIRDTEHGPSLLSRFAALVARIGGGRR